MRADDKRPYYIIRRGDPPKTSILECVLAVVGALFMAAIFVAAVASLR